MAENNPHSTSDNDKLVGFQGLAHYHHNVCSGLGLENDTLAYNYEIGEGYDDENHQELEPPTDVKGAIDQLFDKTAIMCDPAKSYFEKAYHKLFSDTYDVTATVASTTNINPNTDTSKSITFTATFSVKATLKYPGDDGSQKEVDKTGTITKVTNVTGKATNGVTAKDKTLTWTLKEGTTNVFTTTVTVDMDGDGDFDYTKNITVSCSGTVTYKKWDPATLTELSTTGSGTASASARITFTRNNLWFNNLTSMDAATFNANYNTSNTFAIPSEKNYATIDKTPLIYCSTTSGLKITQLTKSVVIETGTLNTKLGTYYYYKTGNANGTDWEVKIEK